MGIKERGFFVALFLLVFVLFLFSAVRAEVIVLNATENTNYTDGYIDNNLVLESVADLNVQKLVANTRRSFIDFNTSLIPNGATISSVALNLTLSDSNLGSIGIDVYGLNQTAKSLSASSVWSQCAGGAGSTSFVTNTLTWDIALGQRKGVDLGTNAVVNLTNFLSHRFFSVCLKLNNEGVTSRRIFNSSESPIATERPQLTVVYSSDTTPPQVTIHSPTNKTYNAAEIISGLLFNVSLNENGSVRFSLNNGAVNYTMSSLNNQNFNFTNTSIANGQYTMNVYANDTAGNENHTESVVFVIDKTNPQVTINLPTATTYTTATTSVNITLNEGGYCEYSLDLGLTNNTLTNNTANTEFIATTASLSNAAYTLKAYCNDTAGNGNYTTNVSFTINVASVEDPVTPPGGGGGGCTVTTSTCGDWGECVDEKQTRSCQTNCGTRTERQDCVIEEECVNECTQEGNYCQDNNAITCEISNSCYKIVNSISCSVNQTCYEGECVDNSEEDNEVIDNIVDNIGEVAGNTWELVKKIPRPSSFIPHGEIPEVVVDSGVVVVVGAVAWFGWLWLLTLFLPLFLVKLRHYSVSVIDSGNKLGIFDKGKINSIALENFVEILESKYGKMVFANRNDQEKIIKYLVDRGFIEISFEAPFVITAHFARTKDSKTFEKALNESLNKVSVGEGKIRIMKSKEKASIFRVWRAWRRQRKSEKEIEGIFGGKR